MVGTMTKRSKTVLMLTLVVSLVFASVLLLTDKAQAKYYYSGKKYTFVYEGDRNDNNVYLVFNKTKIKLKKTNRHVCGITYEGEYYEAEDDGTFDYVYDDYVPSEDYYDEVSNEWVDKKVVTYDEFLSKVKRHYACDFKRKVKIPQTFYGKEIKCEVRKKSGKVKRFYLTDDESNRLYVHSAKVPTKGMSLKKAKETRWWDDHSPEFLGQSGNQKAYIYYGKPGGGVIKTVHFVKNKYVGAAKQVLNLDTYSYELKKIKLKA